MIKLQHLSGVQVIDRRLHRGVRVRVIYPLTDFFTNDPGDNLSLNSGFNHSPLNMFIVDMALPNALTHLGMVTHSPHCEDYKSIFFLPSLPKHSAGGGLLNDNLSNPYYKSFLNGFSNPVHQRFSLLK